MQPGLGLASSGLAMAAVACCIGAGCSSEKPADNSIMNRPTGGRTSGTSTGGTAGAASAGGGAAGSGGAALFSCNDRYEGLEDCGTLPLQARTVPVNILLLIDKSASMRTAGLGVNVTKWEALYGALRDALDPLKYYASFGLELFPAADVTNATCKAETCCRVADQPDIAIGDGTVTVPQILSFLDPDRAPPVAPGGNTPTAAALARAYQYFQTHPVSAEVAQSGKQLVFLLTDGGPNCNSALTCDATSCTTNLDHAGDPNWQTDVYNYCDNDPMHDGPLFCLDDQATVDQINRLRTDLGVSTVVIGIPGSEPYVPALNAFAVAGGKPNPHGPQSYYQVTEPGQLTQIFIQTATELITTCNILLEQPPPDIDRVNVAVDCTPVSRVNGSGEVQWSIDASTTPAKLVLQGSLCAQAEQSGLGRVEVLLGCPSVN